jgi:hypothetical protein
MAIAVFLMQWQVKIPVFKVHVFVRCKYTYYNKIFVKHRATAFLGYYLLVCIKIKKKHEFKVY